MNSISDNLIELLFNLSHLNNEDDIVAGFIHGFFELYPISGIFWNNYSSKIDFENKNFFNDHKDVIEKTLAILITNIEKIELSETHKRVVENSSDMLWELDSNSNFTYVSPRSFDILGYYPNELIGKSAFDLMNPEEVLKVEKEFQPYVADKKPFYSLINVNIHKDGHEVIIESSGMPKINIKGELIGFSGIDRDITLRKSFENALRESEHTFRALFEKGPIGIAFHKMIYDENGKSINYLFLDVNNSYKELTGINPVGMLVTEAFPGIEKESFDWIGTYGEVAKTGKDIRIQQYLESNNRWYDCVVYQHKPDQFVVAFLEITEGKKAEIELKHTKEALSKRVIALTKPLENVENIHFEDLFNINDIQKLQDEFADATGVSAIITTPNGEPITKRGHFTSFCKMVRDSRIGCEKCIISNSFLVDMHLNRPHIRRCKSAGLWEAGAAIKIEGKHIANWIIGQIRDDSIKEEDIINFANEIKVDKDLLLQEYYKVPIMDLDRFNKIVKMLITLATQLSTLAYQNIQQARYIANEKKAEQLITKERDRAQKYLDTVEAVIIALDRDGYITLINRKGCELFESTEDKLKGKNWFKSCLLQPYGSDTVFPYFKKLMEGEINHNEYFENDIITSNGKVRSIAWHNSLLFNEDGIISGSLSAGEDITDKKISEEALKKSEEALKKSEELLYQSRKLEAIGQLAGGVAHDFNNMLGGIMAGSLMLQKSVDKSELTDKYFSIISHSVKRASELTAKLLTFSRTNNSEKKSLDINKIILETVSLLDNTLDKKIKVITDLNANKFFVLGDESQLQSLIMNLCINASHVLNQGGEIKLLSKNRVLGSEYCNYSSFELIPGEYIEIEVRDNGSGIKDEHLPHIFDPFYTTKERGKGTGLGLSVAYGTVKQFNGSITVRSEVGIGTSFIILLPITDEIPINAVNNHIIMFGSGTILLIDDEVSMRVAGRDILEGFGYDVLLAEDGIEGLKQFKNNIKDIKLVILDMIMPNMSGLDCFKELKKINSNIPIIITSGYTTNKDLKELKNLGYNGFLKKPYTEIELNKIIFDTI